MPPRTKTSPLGFRVGPKLAYALKLAARERSVTVSTFVEQTLSAALLQPEEQPGYDPSYVPASASSPALPTRWEALWDEDDATRFYLLGRMRPDLMDENQKRLWRVIGEGSTLPEFKTKWNDPMVDTTHLAMEENNA